MKLLTFNSYKRYINAQRKTLRFRGRGPYFNEVQIEKAARWLRNELGTDPVNGICHGARNGLECDEFKKHYPLADIFGTDLFPYSGKSAIHREKASVIVHDFSIQKPEWVDHFDFVFCNSMDHARDPAATIRVWLEQLSDRGRLLVKWVPNPYDKVKGGDCYSASLWEYVQLGNLAGVVVDLLYTKIKKENKNFLRRKSLESVILGIKKKT